VVLDSWAVLAWLQREAGGRRVRRALERAGRSAQPLLLSIINAGEIYYLLARAGGTERADEFITDLRRHRLPIRLAPATATRVWQAARLKARYAIAYADAFAAALAQETKRPLLTGDGDFRPLERDEICAVVWLTPAAGRRIALSARTSRRRRPGPPPA